MLGNHWLLAALVDLALLLAVAVGVARRRWDDATDLAERFLPVARLLPARLLLLRVVRQAQLGVLRPVGELRHLLLRRVHRLRRARRRSSSTAPPGSQWTVIVGDRRGRARRSRGCCCSAAPGTSAWSSGWPSTPCWPSTAPTSSSTSPRCWPRSSCSSCPPSAASWVAERVGSVRARLAPARRARARAWCTSAWSRSPVLAGWRWRSTPSTPTPGPAAGLVAVAGRTRSPSSSPSLRFLRQRPAGAGPAARSGSATSCSCSCRSLVVANGLTPYLELKTGYGWNMYANLRTVDGETNHFLVRAHAAAHRRAGDLVQHRRHRRPRPARATRDRDYALTWQQLRALPVRPPGHADHATGAATPRVALGHASDDPELVAPGAASGRRSCSCSGPSTSSRRSAACPRSAPAR